MTPKRATCGRFAIDIETEANPDVIATLPPPEVALGNLKDPIKIEEKMQEAKRKQIAGLALNPFTCRVLCVTIAAELENAKTVMYEMMKDADRFTGTTIEDVALNEHQCAVTMHTMKNPPSDTWESDLLYSTWRTFQAIRSACERGIVTFNGASFDIPILTLRSLMLGVRAPRIETNKYKVLDDDQKHLDAYLYFAGMCGSYGSNISLGLDFVGRSLLGKDYVIGWPGEVDKSNLRALPAAQVVAGNIADAVNTLRLAQVIKAAN